MKFTVEANSVEELIDALRQLIALHDKPKPLPDGSVKALGLTVRAENCLLGGGIETIAQLVALRRIHLLATPNLGRKAANEIEEKLAARGLSLAP